MANQETISIEEFNQINEMKNEADYLSFKKDWFSFLAGTEAKVSNAATPAWTRKATEDFLLGKGGLKAKFAQASRNSNFAFSLIRPVDELDRKAGFHRAYKSIFMDINRTTANEWLMLFVHEVAHSLDSELYRALGIYNNETFVKELAQLGKKTIRLSDLNTADRARLDQWLYAGLNRGFLAEYRAWLLTYLVYEDGLQDGTFTKIDWLEKLGTSKPPDIAIQAHILRSLSPSWVDPSEGIFSYVFIQQALKELRQKIDANPELVDLGFIGELITP